MGKKCLGISAGASAPEHIVVMEIADYFRERGAAVEQYNVMDEHMKFTMPRELTIKQEEAARDDLHDNKNGAGRRSGSRGGRASRSRSGTCTSALTIRWRSRA